MSLSRNFLEICGTRTVLICVSLTPVKTASFCLRQVQEVKKLGQHNEIKNGSPREKKYMNISLICQCFHIVD